MDDQIFFRPPTSSDARAMRFLAKDSQVLSVNSTYYYALMSRHFRETCLVAESQGTICGYVTGYAPPEQPDTLFVWQVGVARLCQGQGLGRKMLSTLINSRKPKFLEATIAPDNQASINLFRSLARHCGVDNLFADTPYFTEEELAAGEKAEHLMQVGPFLDYKNN
jgi:L-2,4-diaminobutyric acid acetyltransferase